MKLSGLLLLAATFGLGACSLIPSQDKAAKHRVDVSGETYLLEQITDSTWTASVPGDLKAMLATPVNTAALKQAVEKTSGCKVTDSDYSRQGRQFDAQVDCGGKLDR